MLVQTRIKYRLRLPCALRRKDVPGNDRTSKEKTYFVPSYWKYNMRTYVFEYPIIFDYLVSSSRSNLMKDPYRLSRRKRDSIRYGTDNPIPNPRTISNACQHPPLHPPFVASRPLSPRSPPCPEPWWRHICVAKNSDDSQKLTRKSQNPPSSAPFFLWEFFS